jgi:hypothetical protein
MKKRTREDGYYNYYSETDSYCRNRDDHDDKEPFINMYSERKNFDRVFWTRGILAAYQHGKEEAGNLLRGMYDWLDSHPEYKETLTAGLTSTNGAPGWPLLFLSPLGKEADMVNQKKYFDRDVWFKLLAERLPQSYHDNPIARPHCYGLLWLETLIEEYMATGEEQYKNAFKGAWDVYERWYKHTGGFTAICEEGGPYPPGSFYINNGHTGEVCGQVFWLWINELLCQLYPEEEKYHAQVEEILFNAILSCRTAEFHKRYHERLEGERGDSGEFGSCCETSSTMAIAKIPQYIYQVSSDIIYINQFISSSISTKVNNVDVKLSMHTDFPTSGKVAIRIDETSGGEFALSIRTPYWSRPGERAVHKRNWKAGDEITFIFDIEPRFYQYTGWEQDKEGRRRYTLLYGPILMALLDKDCVDGNTTPCIKANAEALPKQLKADADKPLHLQTPDGRIFVPYCEAPEKCFSCVPVIET